MVKLDLLLSVSSVEGGRFPTLWFHFSSTPSYWVWKNDFFNQ